MNPNSFLHLRIIIAKLGVFIVSIALLALIGCGGSEEATQTEEAMQMEADTTAVEPDTSAVAEDTTTTGPIDTAQPEAVQPDREQELIAQNESLKAENTQLKEQLDAADQTNKELMAKVSDLEAAQLAAQEQVARAAQEKQKTVEKKKSDSTIKRKMVPGTSTSEEVQAYENAVGLANERKFKEAIDNLQALLDANIKTDYADNCHYWIGLCYFGLRDYQTALQHFKEVQKFKVSEKKDDAQLMIAKAHDRIGDKKQADTEYRKLIEMYPNSEFVPQAQAKIR